MKVNKEQGDRIAERTIISALLHHGEEVFYDIDACVKDVDFFYNENKIIYSTIKHLITKENIVRPDIHTIVNSLTKIDQDAASKYQVSEYLTALSADHITKENVGPFYRSVAKLALKRNLTQRLKEAYEDLMVMDVSDKSIIDIINQAERPVIEFTNEIISSNEIIDMSKYVIKYLTYVANERPNNLGIPTGFPRYDQLIGGGLRKPGVHLAAARAKVGKTTYGITVADNVTLINIPVLFLDTEITPELFTAKWTAMSSGVEVDSIERGKFVGTEDAIKIKAALNTKLSKQKLHYQNIAGRHHTDWLSIIRKWIAQHVGFNDNGQANDCLVILDYIKMMDTSHCGNFQEHQYLGQVITDLHNLAIKYNIAILSFVQLNREGINREDQGIIAGSDKLIGLCSSAVMIKIKGADDLVDDPLCNGDRKLITLAARFGPGTEVGEYINLKTDLSRAIIKEGLSNLEIRGGKNIKSKSNQNEWNQDGKEESELRL